MEDTQDISADDFSETEVTLKGNTRHEHDDDSVSEVPIEDDSFMDCIILALFPFYINGTRYHHTFAVGPITDVILGLDLLMEHHGIVDLPGQSLKLGQEHIPLKIIKTSMQDS